MLIEKQVLVGASITKVWQLLTDIPVMASCMPGVEELKVIDANTYSCIAKGKMAYLSASFNMLVTITEKREPVSMQVVAEGTERHGLGRFRQEQIFSLKSVSGEETEIKYKSELVMSGKLFALGRKAIIAKIDEIAESSLKSFVVRCGVSETPLCEVKSVVCPTNETSIPEQSGPL